MYWRIPRRSVSFTVSVLGQLSWWRAASVKSADAFTLQRSVAGAVRKPVHAVDFVEALDESARTKRLPAGAGQDYRLLSGVRQPHSQFVDWQRHAPSGHPQEQLVQSQVPQEVVATAVWSGAFFGNNILDESVRFRRQAEQRGSDFGVELEEGVQGSHELGADFVFASLDEMHADACFTPAFQGYFRLGHLRDFFGGQEAHSIDQGEFGHSQL